MICLVVSAGPVLLALPLAASVDGRAVTSWSDAPIAAFIFPLIGLFIAPIYPAINSFILSSLPLRQHGPMAGLIVIFSTLGGTTGSIITGNVFEAYGGQIAFYLSLIPIVVLLLLITLFSRMQKKQTIRSNKRSVSQEIDFKCNIHHALFLISRSHQQLPRPLAGVFAIFDNGCSVHQHPRNAGRVGMRLLVSSAVGHSFFVEQNNVSGITGT